MDLSNKKILFTGFSILEGSASKALYDYLKRTYHNTDIYSLYWGGHHIADALPPDVTAIEIPENNNFSAIDFSAYDIVFRHTTTRPQKLTNAPCVSTAENEFFKRSASKNIIGVTGTKGKGTTCSLIAEICKAAGRRVHLVGNIGTPALTVLDDVQPDDIVVYELSSFQLWDLEQSPPTAVVLMMEPDHLDIHASIQEYKQAKSSLCASQTSQDFLVHHPNNTMTLDTLAGDAKRVAYMDGDSSNSCFVQDGQLTIAGHQLCKTSEVALRGKHNLENICAAVTAIWPQIQDVDAIRQVLTTFAGLPHRIEFYKEAKGFAFYDDSFAAAPSAAVVASHAFPGKKIIQLVGGLNRELEYQVFAQMDFASLRKVLLMGENAKAIAAIFDSAGYTEYLFVADMQEAIHQAVACGQAGDIVLLSPGSPSFDMYKNYKERAADFRKQIDAL